MHPVGGKNMCNIQRPNSMTASPMALQLGNSHPKYVAGSQLAMYDHALHTQTNDNELIPESLSKKNIDGLQLKLSEIKKSYHTICEIIKILDAIQDKYSAASHIEASPVCKILTYEKNHTETSKQIENKTSKKTNSDIFGSTAEAQKINEDFIKKNNENIKTFNVMKENFSNEIIILEEQIRLGDQASSLSESTAETFNMDLNACTQTINEIIKDTTTFKEELNDEPNLLKEKLKTLAIIGCISLISGIIDTLFTFGIICLSQLCLSIITTFLMAVAAILEGKSNIKELIDDHKQSSLIDVLDELKASLKNLKNSINELNNFASREAYANYHRMQTINLFREIKTLRDNEINRVFRERHLVICAYEEFQVTENNTGKNLPIYSSESSKSRYFFAEQKYSYQRTMPL